jgi:PRTRC genetic system ThiF family protein
VIRDAVTNWSTVSYAMDIGNSADSGQFILGEPLNERNRRSRLRLRCAWELFPEIVDPSLDDDGQPSCSAAAALEAQEPFINSTLAQHALALVARLFRYGEISHHGGFVNLATGATSVLRIDPQNWKRSRRVTQRNSELRQRKQGSASVL